MLNKVQRLAVMMRDGFACVYCGASIEEGVELTLDEVRTGKYVTMCHNCSVQQHTNEWKNQYYTEQSVAFIEAKLQTRLRMSHVRGLVAMRRA